MDKAKEIRRAVETGKVSFGQKQAEKTLLEKKAEMVIISSSAPKPAKETMKYYAGLAGTPLMEFEGNGFELGAVCGKPFNVSVLLIVDAGKSKILEATEEKEDKPKKRPAAKKKKEQVKKE